MKARFLGDGDHTVTTVFGQDFPVDTWVETTNAKLIGNPMFEVDVDDDGKPDPGEQPTVEDLRAKLDALGVSYHPRAGVAKLSAMLTEEGA